MPVLPPDPNSSQDEDLPKVRDPRTPFTPAAQGRVVKEIRRAVRAHGTFETACEQAGIKLERLEQWMQENPHLEATLVKDRADFKAKLSADAQDTMQSPATRKLALEMLSRLDKSWAPRTRTTLATQLQDFLDESKRVEPPEVYARMIARLQKYT